MALGRRERFRSRKVQEVRSWLIANGAPVCEEDIDSDSDW
jgi:hypothetical protein